MKGGMKRIFKIVVIICPLLNAGLFIFLAARNSSGDTKRSDRNSMSVAEPEATMGMTAVGSEMYNNSNMQRNYSVPRSYLIKFDECFER